MIQLTNHQPLKFEVHILILDNLIDVYLWLLLQVVVVIVVAVIIFIFLCVVVKVPATPEHPPFCPMPRCRNCMSSESVACHHKHVIFYLWQVNIKKLTCSAMFSVWSSSLELLQSQKILQHVHYVSNNCNEYEYCVSVM